MQCEICQKQYKSRQCLSRHIKVHNIDYKQYYDTYLKSGTEGICPVCHKETNWARFKYNDHCSTKCSSLDPEVKQKLINTNIERYNCEHHFQNPEILQKQSDANMKAFGCRWPLQNKKIRDQQHQTMINKYGVDSIFKTDAHINKNRTELHEKTYNSMKTKSDHTRPEFPVEEYIGSGTPKIYSWKCIHCQHIFGGRYYEGKIPLCPTCFPRKRSNGQNEIYNFLSKNLGLQVTQNYKKLIYPMEIDLYVESHKIAIEYNGNYWHSELQGVGKKYHLEKTNLCKNVGVRLIHIMEDEWLYKPEIVKSRLKNLFVKTKYKIYARKCIIREIDSKTKGLFLDKYHLQGNDKSCIHIGAFYKNRLISVMTFSKLRVALGRQATVNEYELSRFCSVGNFSCVGISSKLLKFFITVNNPGKIITYADMKWSDSSSFYTTIGFTQTHQSPPNYWYVHKSDYLVKLHRYNFRKNILVNSLDTFDPIKTEWENMKANGYDRIWDCGNLVFEL